MFLDLNQLYNLLNNYKLFLFLVDLGDLQNYLKSKYFFVYYKVMFVKLIGVLFYSILKLFAVVLVQSSRSRLRAVRRSSGVGST